MVVVDGGAEGSDFFFLGGAISSDWAIRPYLFTYSFLFYQVFFLFTTFFY